MSRQVDQWFALPLGRTRNTASGPCRCAHIVRTPRSLKKFQNPRIPYAIRTPETYFVHLSSETHIRELIEAPEEKLSLHALSKDVSPSTLPPKKR